MDKEKEKPLESLFSAKRILVVDDHLAARKATEFILQLEGAKVVTAENGRQGADYYDQARENGQPFDLVITDWQMVREKESGRFLIESIRTQEDKEARVPVLLVTAKRRKDIDLDLEDLGVVYFEKVGEGSFLKTAAALIF